MPDEAGPKAVEVAVQEQLGTARSAARPLLAWGFLTALALPLAVHLLVAARGLTGHSPFLDGEPDATYTRISGAVLGQGTSIDLLPTLVGLAFLALLSPRSAWAPRGAARRTAAGLAALTALTSVGQTLLVAYLLLAKPRSDNGVTFVADSAKVEQLAAPLAGASHPLTSHPLTSHPLTSHPLPRSARGALAPRRRTPTRGTADRTPDPRLSREVSAG